MLAAVDAAATTNTARTRRLGDRLGDGILHGITAGAALLSVALVAAIVWRIVDGAIPAIHHFGIEFIWSTDWNPVLNEFGAAQFIVGTLVRMVGR